MKLEPLIQDLEEAEKLASKYTDGYSEMFSSAEEFHLELRDRLEKLKEGKWYVIDELNIWFLPTCSWDDFIGKEGIDLGNKISEQLIRLQKELNNL